MSTSRPTKLPPVRDMAALIRSGATIDDIAQRYGVTRQTARAKFSLSNFDPETGEELVEWTRPSLPRLETDTGAMHYVQATAGAGEPLNIPLQPVRYRNERREPPTGLDWERLRADALARGGLDNCHVWRNPRPGRAAPASRVWGGWND